MFWNVLWFGTFRESNFVPKNTVIALKCYKELVLDPESITIRSAVENHPLCAIYRSSETFWENQKKMFRNCSNCSKFSHKEWKLVLESITIRSAIENYPLEVISRPFQAFCEQNANFLGSNGLGIFKGIGAPYSSRECHFSVLWQIEFTSYALTSRPLGRFFLCLGCWDPNLIPR